MTDEFRTHPIYYLLTGGSLLLFALLSWDLWHYPTPGTLLFVGITLAATVWFALALNVHVRLSANEVTITRPYREHIPIMLPVVEQSPTQTIAHRQLVSVEMSGRLLSALTLLYYPIQPDGLLDFDRIGTLTLPVLTRQEDLHKRLEAAIPQ